VKELLFPALTLAGCCFAGGVAAQTDACGKALSAPVATVWQAEGGATGRLGCPTAAGVTTAKSLSGVVAVETDFAGGAVLSWPEASAREGQAFAVSGCLYRLWFQYGGPSGWLGLPTSQARNTPDGQRQSFEGGEGWFSRAPNTCRAEKSG